jgi:uncharacterized protein YndB with AHSA1/START domain
MSDELTFTQRIQAPAAQVYRAFTNASALREWLSDVATVAPQPGGRFYVAWHSGYFAAGVYTALEADKSVAFTWRGPEDPQAAQINVTLTPEAESVLVTLTRSGPLSGYAGQDALEALKRDWRESLENLASVLEQGPDLRIFRRPMLGILLADFNAEIAARMGVPVSTGLRLDDAVEGFGAFAAGLRGEDVLVAMDDQPLTSYVALANFMRNKRAGDVVTVTFYRGADKLTTQMTLSARPQPEIPATPQALAEALRKIFTQLGSELAACFEGASEAAAERSPAPGEWSAKEVLAHLIHVERENIIILADIIAGQERWADDFGGNLHARVQATLRVHQTLAELQAELQRNWAELAALVELLPAEFVQRRSSYWRVAVNLTQGAAHTQNHLAQIRTALEAAQA